MTDLEEKEKVFREAQIACDKAEAEYYMVWDVLPERLAWSKAQTIRNRAWIAYIKAGG